MKRHTAKLVVLGAAVFSIAALFSIHLLAEETHHHGQQTPPTAGQAPVIPHSMHEMCAKKLDEAMKAIDSATKAVEADQKVVALAELKKAKEVVAGCQKTLSAMGQAKIVNIRCPIQGTKLDPEKVPQNLTRMYMGKKIGFCCPGCPEQWDILSPQEKAKKFAEVMPAKPALPDAESGNIHPHSSGCSDGC